MCMTTPPYNQILILIVITNHPVAKSLFRDPISHSYHYMLGTSSQYSSQICNTSHKLPDYNFCNHSHFSILYFNSRSLLPKIDELRALCSAYHPSVVCLTETWLCPDVQDNELLIPNYTIVWLDRNRHGGGIAMFVNNSLSIKTLLHGPMGLELIVVSLYSRHHFNCCVGVFYRPLSSQLHIFNSLFDTLFFYPVSLFCSCRRF